MGRFLLATLISLAVLYIPDACAGAPASTVTEVDDQTVVYGEQIQIAVTITRLREDTTVIAGAVHLYLDGELIDIVPPYDPYLVFLDEETGYYYITVYILLEGTVPVGDHEITVIWVPEDDQTEGSTDTATLTITPADATIDAFVVADDQTKVYGDPVPPLTATVTGTINGDVLNYTLSTTADEFSNVGGYPIIVMLGSNPNYNVTATDGVLHVTKASAAIEITGYSTTYDRQPYTATGTATGVFGEDLSAGLDLSGTTHTLAGSYTDDWTFAGGNNYSDAAGTVDDEIARRPAAWFTSDNFKYFGDADPEPLTGGFGVDFIAEDNVTATYSRDSGETVGFYLITATLSEGSLDNYIIFNPGASFEIRASNFPPVALAQVVDSANQITDQDQQFEVASQCQTLVQLIGANSTDPDADPLSYHWTAIKHTDVGDVAIDLGAAADTANPAVSVSLGSYEFTLTVADPSGGTSSDSINVEIVDTTPPSVTLAGPNPQTIIYHHGSTYTDLGADASDSCSAALSGPTVQFQSGMGLVPVSNVDETVPGTYYVTWTATDPSGNSTTATRTVIIAKALLTITANDATRLYGAANPVFTGTISGKDPADSIVVTYSSVANASSPVGDYPIVPAVVNLAHWQQFYDVVIVNGTLYVIAGGFGGMTTYTQGGWGAAPNGNNPGALLHANFTAVYGSLCEVGIPGTGGYSMKFTSAGAITTYLPAGGPPKKLTADLTNPSSSPAGVFGGQTLALKLNVNFSDAGFTQGSGGPFGALILTGTGTSLDGSTVAQILAAAQQALGGGALPAGYTLSSLNGLCDNLNQSFDNGVASSWAQAHLTH